VEEANIMKFRSGRDLRPRGVLLLNGLVLVDPTLETYKWAFLSLLENSVINLSRCHM